MSRRVVRIDWNGVPPASLRGNARGHTRTKIGETKNLREVGMFEAMNATEERGIERADVFIAYKNNRLIDYDNFLKGLKPFFDGIVDAGVLIDDNPKVIRKLSIEGHTCKRGGEKTVIQISEVKE